MPLLDFCRARTPFLYRGARFFYRRAAAIKHRLLGIAPVPTPVIQTGPTSDEQFLTDLNLIAPEIGSVTWDTDAIYAEMIVIEKLFARPPPEIGSLLVKWIAGMATRHGKEAAIVAFWQYTLDYRNWGQLMEINRQIAEQFNKAGWFDSVSDESILTIKTAVCRKIHYMHLGDFLSIFNAVGFVSDMSFEWLRKLADMVVVQWTIDIAGLMRYELLEYAIGRFGFYIGLRTQSEAEFITFFQRLQPALRDSGERIGRLYESHDRFSYLPREARNPKKIAFIATDADISGCRMSLSIIDGIRKCPELDYLPSLHVMRGQTPKLTQACADLNCEIVYYDLLSSTDSYLERFYQIKEALSQSKTAMAVWTHLPWIAPAALSIQLAPVQALLSQHLSIPAMAAGPLAHFTLEGMGGKLIERHGISWQRLPLSLYDVIAEPPPEAAALREKHLGTGTILLGSVARAEKINNPDFLGVVCNLLKAYPQCRFLWAGEAIMQSVQAFFEQEGVAGQTVFAGWVDPAVCAAALDIYLDSFPFASGMTAIQAMALETPVISMRSRYSLLGRDVADAYEQGDTPPEVRSKLQTLLDPLKQDGLLPIVDDAADYRRLAGRLIEDAVARQRVGAALRETSLICFQDTVRMAKIFFAHMAAF